MHKHTFHSILFFWLVFLATMPVFAQKKYFKKGLKAVENAEYAEALPLFEQALSSGYSPSETNYRLAETYRMSNQIAKAEPYYRAALENGFTSPEAEFYFAKSLKANGKYEESKRIFEIYARSGENADLARLARDEAKSIEDIKKMLEEPNYYEISNCKGLNSDGAEFSPVLTEEGKLVFTASRKEGELFKTTGGNFTGIYVFEFRNENECRGSASLLTEQINMPGINEASATFSPDGRTVVFARGNTGEKDGARNVDLYMSYLVGEEWSIPELLEISDPESWDSSPFISPDGTKLYFSSNRPYGFGGTDLYEAKIMPNGTIVNPRNLGNKINTPGNEMFPYVADDGRIFFSSDGHPGFGSLDLFAATIDRENRKTTIKNLGPPFNSSGDDFAIFYSTDTSGYFSSNRPGGRGDDDIYTFIDKTPKTRIVNYYLQITAFTREGKDSTELILPDTEVQLVNNKNEVIYAGTTDEQGRLPAFPVELHKDYVILGAKNGFFTKREPYTTRGKAMPAEFLSKPVTDTTLEARVELKKIIINEAIVLENIYYDRFSAEIRVDAARELDKLVALLQDNPNIYIELSSHTDARGNESYNEDLSQQRAQSAVDYIISKGVSPRRLQAQGYGKQQLIIVDALTEEEHQVNRRTEFKVTKIVE